MAIPGLAIAGEEAISPADTGFMLIASAMVMLMLPGIAFFYGGMSSRRDVINTIMMSMTTLCVISLVWVLWGYSLAFGTTTGGFIGSLEFLAFSGVGMEPSGTIPHGGFAVFQLMFAALTVALISGALVGRMRFSAFLIFGVLWVTVVYAPLCHWVWGGGWLGDLGVLDFAGGKVVHISSGVAALVACLVLGARKGYGKRPMPPHHLPMVLLGAGMLWFGWFGFNAGSALEAGALAASAFVVTQIAASAGALGWIIAEWIRHGKPTLLGLASGCIAGLVSITPAAGFVDPMAAIVIGLGGGLICFLAVSILKKKLGYDDSLDVFGIHGIGGIWGAMITAVFAVEAIGGVPGLLEGNAAQLGIQAIAVVSTIVFVGIATFILLKLVGLIVPLRVTENDEDIGLDIASHGEDAYSDQTISGGVLYNEQQGVSK
ncbi:MAG: ammonium transporter [Desulfotomaculum sp.]|nr:ammonium transporter [Desulfotomaculum sp.]MCL0081469.1 ammonium transporter [Peptococcaceae bacterium]